MSRPAPNKEALPIANCQQSSIAPEISWQGFLTRLVQNLTLRNDCNLIPSAHGTQHLSSQSNHWTIGGSLHQDFLYKDPFQRGEMKVDDPKLLPGVVGF